MLPLHAKQHNLYIPLTYKVAQDCSIGAAVVVWRLLLLFTTLNTYTASHNSCSLRFCLVLQVPLKPRTERRAALGMILSDVTMLAVSISTGWKLSLAVASTIPILLGCGFLRLCIHPRSHWYARRRHTSPPPATPVKPTQLSEPSPT